MLNAGAPAIHGASGVFIMLGGEWSRAWLTDGQPGRKPAINVTMRRGGLAARTTNVAYVLFSRLSRPGFLCHLRFSFGGYDEPEILR